MYVAHINDYRMDVTHYVTLVLLYLRKNYFVLTLY